MLHALDTWAMKVVPTGYDRAMDCNVFLQILESIGGLGK